MKPFIRFESAAQICEFSKHEVQDTECLLWNCFVVKKTWFTLADANNEVNSLKVVLTDFDIFLYFLFLIKSKFIGYGESCTFSFNHIKK